ncbi:MAG TPA: Ig-like domain-containing protein [Archangium sp.]|uniref:Ig-like domain-containing protein n=1 Tax=Archangium sp. TaxID=1872627 RepID=UPI002E315F0B|nr:Ig-like domain-containing protein [Archangium sp.]HEX5753993.1 Ig-like domain-containing protein [Archangium sp.]
MRMQTQSLRAMWLAPLLACVLAACGGDPSVNAGSGSDGTADSPRDSGTTSPTTDGGTGTGTGSDAGTGDAGTVDSGTCPGSGTCSGADAGSGTDSDAGTGTDMDAGTGTGSDAGTGTDTDAGVAPLSANAGGDKTLCAGQSASIGLPASGGLPPYTYAWSASPACTGCFDSATVASPIVTPTVTTTFTQTVTDALLQTASAGTVVTVLPSPGIAGSDMSIDPGASTVIGPTPVSGGSYTWSCNRADCALSSANVAQPVAGPTRTTTYTLDASSGPGCTTRSTLTVQVNLKADTVPLDGETAFPLTSALLVQFDQPINPATLSSSTVRVEEALTGTPVTVNLSYDAAKRQLWVKLPTGASYTALTDYTLTLKGGATGIASDDAIQPNLFPADVQVDFTTDNAPDTTPPAITFRSPASGLTGVASNVSVVVTFSEAVNPATVTGTQFTLSSAGGPVTGTVRYDAASWTATFTPSAALAANTVYTASLSNVQDLSGLSIAATSWTFTTGTAPDTAPPTVTAVSPAAGASSVASSDPILVTFSENVDIATLTGLRLLQVSNGTAVAGGVTYNATTRVATFTPSVLLGSLTTYEVNVSGVKDLAGNAMTAPFTSRFTTRRTLFADDFEGGAGAWSLPAPTTGVAWSLTTANFHSSNHSLTDSAVGKYLSNVVSYAELAAPLSVSGLSSVSVQFWMKARTERNKDFVSVEASVDGGAWTPLTARRYTGNLSWAVRSLNLPLSGKSTLRIRFRFESNATKNFDGVYVDDIIIQSP